MKGKRSVAERAAAALRAWRDPAALAAVAVRVDDSGGWKSWGANTNERDQAETQQLYADALTAWRKNPFAKRLVDLTTDHCLGDGMIPTAPGEIGRFLDRWWNHAKNAMPLRLPELSDELCRAGDLFLTLHRNDDDGLSYLRPVPKDRILSIDTAANDWETELAYYEASDGPEPRRWLSPAHEGAPEARAIMLHYRVNGVVGCLLGESDLAPILPWLLRYSRMLEDRVRLHWALKAFLWMVTVPSNAVAAKRDQYNSPPESGSVIVKDASESWEAVTPNLHAFDAQYDLWAVRQMIDTGGGFPPHWRGEATDVNLATATAMERAATRHLRRRQLTLRHLVVDLCHTAYSRAYEIGRARAHPDRSAIRVDMPDLSRQDNKDLAAAARDMAAAMETLGRLVEPNAALRRKALDQVFRFAGEALTPDELNRLATAQAGEGS